MITHFIYTALHTALISFRPTKSTKFLICSIMSPRSYPNTSNVQGTPMMLVSSKLNARATTAFNDLALLSPAEGGDVTKALWGSSLQSQDDKSPCLYPFPVMIKLQLIIL